MKLLFTPSLILLALTTPALADDIFTDDVSAQAGVCIGDNCANDEIFDLTDFDSHLRLKGSWTKIEFNDISGSSSPNRDWAIRANEKGGGPEGEAFFIEDVTSGVTPFYIEGSSPDNAIYIRDTGLVGFGTSLPGANLHIASFSQPVILLESTSTFTPSQWQLIGGTNFRIRSALGFINSPFEIFQDAAENSLIIADEGKVGIGTRTPGAQLELSSDEGFNFFRITATGAAVNDSVDITYTGGPLGTGQLRYNIVDGDAQEMSLDADGNMVLDGTLTTAGPTCAGGCDRVFDADYALPSIADHADQMFSLGHLPSIGATIPHAPVNLSERQGDIINALEHAHIYINQLHKRSDTDRQIIADQRTDLEQLRAELEKTRLDHAQAMRRLEGRLDSLENM